MSIFHDQNAFLDAGDVEKFTLAAERLAFELIKEEVEELGQEPYYMAWPEPNAIKEVLDIIYVAAQYLNVTIGPDKALAAWQALHENNMSKCVDGKLIKRKDGKIMKPEGYQKLDLRPVLEKNNGR